MKTQRLTTHFFGHKVEVTLNLPDDEQNTKKKKSCKFLTCRDLLYWYRLTVSNSAERTGYEFTPKYP